MKLSTLLLATLISAMPSYKPNQRKCVSKMSSNDEGYENIDTVKPSDMKGVERGNYEDYIENEPSRNELSQEPSNESIGPKENSPIHRNQESGGNSNTKKGTDGDQANSENQQKLEELNAIRAKVGAPPLQLSDKLNQAAQKHSEDQVQMGEISHTGSNGSQSGDRAKAAGINGGITAENVASGQVDWPAATETWVNSPDHYDNMVDEKYKFVGFGVANKYYTELFSTTN
jgi:uncharacterized protein YkwD